MPIAAVPEYLGSDFSEASPGLRFGLYLSVWTCFEDQRTVVNERASRRSPEAEEIKTALEMHGMKATIGMLANQERNPLPRLWEKSRGATSGAWKKVTALCADDRLRCAALQERQAALAETLASTGEILTLEALSVAPFTTGLGNQHPLENGFAFLNPYGLPYLPGSGVKGVLREAARELASGEWGTTHGWDITAINTLFGSEDSNQAQRGVLSFWDVLPRIKGPCLQLEVMTAHQGHYYQRGETPHESGQPTPIYFLTLPPGSEFNFHVRCDRPFLQRLEPALAIDERWKTLLQVAFEHAFQWLGFGAKTSVGYGAMAPDQHKLGLRLKRAEAEQARRKEEAEQTARREAEAAEEARRQEAFASLTPEEQLLTRLQELLDTMHSLPSTSRAPIESDFNGLRKQVEQQCSTWPAEQQRERAAQILEAFYNLTGWHQPGVKSDKKKKQEKKKRDLIAQIRRGK